MDISQLSKKRLFIPGIDHIPAELKKSAVDGWRIVFYVKNPEGEKLQRIRMRVKPMASAKTRLKHAQRIIQEINLKLAGGWNPLIESENSSAFELFRIALDEFLLKIDKKVRDGSIRPDTQRAYRSYVENIKRYLADNDKMNMFVILYNRKFAVDFLDYIYYTRKNSPVTHNNHLQFLVILGNYFVDKGFISTNPAVGISRLKPADKQRVFIPVEVRALLKEYYESTNPPYLCLMLTTYFCFLRRTELTKLKVSDLHLSRGIVTVKVNAAKASKSEQGVTIPEELIHRFAAHIKNADNSMYLFSDDNFMPGNIQAKPKKISDEWDKARKALKLPAKYKFYGLKDTGITELLDKGLPSYKVQKQARHSDLKMTEKYISHKHYDADNDILRNGTSF